MLSLSLGGCIGDNSGFRSLHDSPELSGAQQGSLVLEGGMVLGGRPPAEDQGAGAKQRGLMGDGCAHRDPCRSQCVHCILQSP